MRTLRPQEPIACSRDKDRCRSAGAAGDRARHCPKHGGERERIDAIRAHERLRHRIPEQLFKRGVVVDIGHGHRSHFLDHAPLTTLTIAP
jgi:hypothetical protein